MPSVVRTLIADFLVPYMNVHVMTGAYMDHNAASKKVLEKNGFIFDSLVPDCIEMLEVKTGVKGKKVGLGRMKWERKQSNRG
jgi:hypothetical protein